MGISWRRESARMPPHAHAGMLQRSACTAQASAFRRLPEFGLGLTDLAKHHSGNDDQLPTDSFDVPALRRKITRHAPCVLAFTSKNAAQAALGARVAYGAQSVRWGETALWVLPSPSGQARRFWDETPWHALVRAVRALR